MKTTFRFGLPRQMAGLLLLLCYLAVSNGHAADAVVLPPGGSASEAIKYSTTPVFSLENRDLERGGWSRGGTISLNLSLAVL
jgi:hypothetical protein